MPVKLTDDFLQVVGPIQIPISRGKAIIRMYVHPEQKRGFFSVHYMETSEDGVSRSMTNFCPSGELLDDDEYLSVMKGLEDGEDPNKLIRYLK